MHGCSRFKGTLNELALGGLTERERAAALAEVRACADCSTEFESITRMLEAIERSVEAATPRGAYWEEYEWRLRAKIERQDETAKESGGLAGIGRVLAIFRTPLHAALGAAVITALVAAGLWFSAVRKQFDSPVGPTDSAATENGMVSLGKPSVDSNDGASAATPAAPAANFGLAVPGRQKRIAAAITLPAREADRHSAPARLSGVGVETKGAEREVEAVSTIASNLWSDPVVKEHLEAVELLLRTIRNRRHSALSAEDSTFQKLLAHELVTSNAVLRRSAKQRGDSFLEELLSEVESPLLDIAHLPHRPPARSFQMIRSVLQRGHVIQSVQTYSDSIRGAGD